MANIRMRHWWCWRKAKLSLSWRQREQTYYVSCQILSIFYLLCMESETKPFVFIFYRKKKTQTTRDTYLSNHFHWRNLSKYMLFRYSWNGSPLRWSRTDLSQMKRIYKHFIILNLEQKRNKTRGENPDFLYGAIILLYFVLYFTHGFNLGTKWYVRCIS